LNIKTPTIYVVRFIFCDPNFLVPFQAMPGLMQTCYEGFAVRACLTPTFFHLLSRLPSPLSRFIHTHLIAGFLCGPRFPLSCQNRFPVCTLDGFRTRTGSFLLLFSAPPRSYLPPPPQKSDPIPYLRFQLARNHGLLSPAWLTRSILLKESSPNHGGFGELAFLRLCSVRLRLSPLALPQCAEVPPIPKKFGLSVPPAVARVEPALNVKHILRDLLFLVVLFRFHTSSLECFFHVIRDSTASAILIPRAISTGKLRG